MYTHKIGVVEFLDKCEVVCCDDDVVTWLDDGVVACLDKNNKDGFDMDFYLNTPWNSFLRKPWVGNV